MPSQTPGKENSGGDLESVVPDSSSIADIEFGSSSLWHTNATAARVDYSTKRMNTSNDVETPQSEVSSMLSMDFSHMNVSQPVVTFQQNGTNKYEQTEKKAIRVRPENIKVEGTNSPFISNNFNVGLSSMKKGFSNLMTSLDSALKPSPEDGCSDTVSMRSDASSDSENYVVISLEDQEKMDATFALDNSIRAAAVEEASEVIEETPDTQSEKSLDSVCKRKDLVNCFFRIQILKKRHLIN